MGDEGELKRLDAALLGLDEGKHLLLNLCVSIDMAVQSFDDIKKKKKKEKREEGRGRRESMMIDGSEEIKENRTIRIHFILYSIANLSPSLWLFDTRVDSRT